MFSTSPLKIATERLPSPDPRFAVTHRQELIAGFDQASLMGATGDLIGAGGIGGEVGEGLCRKGLGRLRIFDHDVVEATNLNRQHFFRRDIGKNKARCLARNLAPHCHAGTTLEGYPFSFEDALALGMDMSASFAVCGVDNSEARVAVSVHYRRVAVPVIFIAVQPPGRMRPCLCAGEHADNSVLRLRVSEVTDGTQSALFCALVQGHP